MRHAGEPCELCTPAAVLKGAEGKQQQLRRVGSLREPLPCSSHRAWGAPSILGVAVPCSSAPSPRPPVLLEGEKRRVAERGAAACSQVSCTNISCLYARGRLNLCWETGTGCSVPAHLILRLQRCYKKPFTPLPAGSHPRQGQAAWRRGVRGESKGEEGGEKREGAPCVSQAGSGAAKASPEPDQALQSQETGVAAPGC